VKALIFNSGLGSRLGQLTVNSPKSMLKLGNGETIFERQIRILHSCGINEFVVTTGPFPEQLHLAASEYENIGCSFTFVENISYAETNYIYSMYLARDYLRDNEIVLLHGDLVFDANYAQKLIDYDYPSLCSTNSTISLPGKDFKGRIVDGMLGEVSVDIFDNNCVALQPFYKLSKRAVGIWLDAVEYFIDKGKANVYAENAANTVFHKMNVLPFSYENHFVEEVDTPEDLERVISAIKVYDFFQQPVFRAESEVGLFIVSDNLVKTVGEINSFAELLSVLRINKPLVVSGSHFSEFRTRDWLDKANVDYKVFGGFSPNPGHEEVLAGVAAYKDFKCDSLISIGGGSAIDVAKCVKLHILDSETGINYKKPKSIFCSNGIPHLSIPTTAGTGSESTHFGVCYIDGVKTSMTDERILPEVALLDASLLKGLPPYQKKCTLLDALCQAIESYWSVRSSSQSRQFSAEAIPCLLANVEGYLAGEAEATKRVLESANLAGRAINLTTTTAAHALSYKITSLYGIPHGHAVAICMPHVWRLLIERGAESAQARLREISYYMTRSENPYDGLEMFERLVRSLEISTKVMGENEDVLDLVSSVNIERLSNFPLQINESDLERIYLSIILPA
jgi:alcohol dehydrogenase class IV/choline kinase